MSTVGVDIGSSSIKVVEIDGIRSDGYARVRRAHIEQLPDGSVVSGRIRDKVAVSSALAKAVRSAGVSKRGVILGISSPDASLANITIPSLTKESERVARIRSLGISVSNAAPLEESALSTNILASSTTAESTPVDNLVVASALDTVVTSVTDVCKLADVTPAAIDLSVVAAARSIVRVAAESSDVIAVVDVGSSHSQICVLQGSSFLGVRPVFSGGNDVTRAVVSAADEDWADAELRKRDIFVSSQADTALVDRQVGYGPPSSVRPSNMLSTKIEDAVVGSSKLLAEQIARSCRSLQTDLGFDFRAVLLCGGSSLLRGFDGLLSQMFTCQVSRARPWAHFERSKKLSDFFNDGSPDDASLLLLSTAIGLGLWGSF